MKKSAVPLGLQGIYIGKGNSLATSGSTSSSTPAPAGTSVSNEIKIIQRTQRSSQSNQNISPSRQVSSIAITPPSTQNKPPSSTSPTPSSSPKPSISPSRPHSGDSHPAPQVNSKNISPSAPTDIPRESISRQKSPQRTPLTPSSSEKKLKLKEAVVGKTLRSQKMELRLKTAVDRQSESTQSHHHHSDDHHENASLVSSSASGSRESARTKIYTPDTNTYGGNGSISNRTKRMLEKQHKLEGLKPEKVSVQPEKPKNPETTTKETTQLHDKVEKNNIPPLSPITEVSESSYSYGTIADSPQPTHRMSMLYPPYPPPPNGYPPPPNGYPPHPNGYPPPPNGYPMYPGYPTPGFNGYYYPPPHPGYPFPFPNYYPYGPNGQNPYPTFPPNFQPHNVMIPPPSEVPINQSPSDVTSPNVPPISRQASLQFESKDSTDSEPSSSQSSVDEVPADAILLAKQILQNTIKSNQSIESIDENPMLMLLNRLSIQQQQTVPPSTQMDNSAAEENLKLQEQVKLLQEQITQLQLVQQEQIQQHSQILLKQLSFSSSHSSPRITPQSSNDMITITTDEPVECIVGEIIEELIQLSEEERRVKEELARKAREMETLELNKKLLDQIEELKKEVTAIKQTPLTIAVESPLSQPSVPTPFSPAPFVHIEPPLAPIDPSPAHIDPPLAPFTPSTERDYQQASLEHKIRTGKELPRVLYRLVPNRSKFKGANELFDSNVDLVVEIASALKAQDAAINDEERESLDPTLTFDYYELAKNSLSYAEPPDLEGIITRRPKINRGSKFSIENPLLQTQDDISVSSMSSGGIASRKSMRSRRTSKDDLEIDPKSILLAGACRPVNWNAGRNKKYDK